MERLREELDLDFQRLVRSSAPYKTEKNKYRLRCDLCKREFFVDKVVFDEAKRSFGFDPTDNPFVCDDCFE